MHRPVTRSRIALAAIIASVAVSSIAFRMITGYGLQQSAALFIGIPALLAIAAVFSPTPRSATGVACKAVTIGLFVSLIFLGEGMLCILMSAPLFYAVAIVVGLVVDYQRRDSPKKHGGRVFSCVALLALVPMSLEGVTAGTSFARESSASETRIVRASADGCRAGAVRAAAVRSCTAGVSERRLSTPNLGSHRSQQVGDPHARRRDAAEWHGASRG